MKNRNTKCPDCGKEMEFGEVQAIDGLLNILNQVIWYPEEELAKRLKRNYQELKLKADGFYCDECMQVIAIYKTR